VSLSTSGGIKRDIAPDSPMLNDEDSAREGRQPYLLARLYDAIGQHLVPRKSGHERLVVRKRLQYLQMAHKLYAQIGATAELRKCADRIGALAVVNADQSLQAFRGRN
jgi:hypothetical protein